MITKLDVLTVFSKSTLTNKEQIMGVDPYIKDPVLEAMFDEDEFDTEKAAPRGTDPNYGKGKWPKAVLVEVAPQAANDYGHSLMLKLHLDGEGTPFTFFVETPCKPEESGDVDQYEKQLKRYNLQLNKLKTLVHATGHLVDFNEKGFKESTKWPKSLLDFNDDAAYSKLMELFGALVGREMGVNVKIDAYTKGNGEKAYRKNVWGLDPRVSSEATPF